jgi:hypothetical protein
LAAIEQDLPRGGRPVKIDVARIAHLRACEYSRTTLIGRA